MSDTGAAALDASWGGGTSPFNVGWQKLMMWIFIVTDALLFAGLLVSYGFVRVASQSWPEQSEAFDMNYITLMTFTLIASSWSMACAVSAASRATRSTSNLSVDDDFRRTIFPRDAGLRVEPLHPRRGATHGEPLGGAAVQHLLFRHYRFPRMHVTTGVIILLVVTIRTAFGKSSAMGVENAGLYWHFVDLVWVFVFALFYLV